LSVVMERRRAVRFKFQLPLIVRWTDGAKEHEVAAVSEDVSSRGIFFFLGERLKTGKSIEVVLTLPHEITFAGKLKVRCFGRIQRYENKVPEGTNAGVAVAIEKYEFLRKS
jgi:hypothetical protein